MPKYIVNFTIGVMVDTKINVGEPGEDVEKRLTDKQWNEIFDKAASNIDISDLSGNVESIIRD